MKSIIYYIEWFQWVRVVFYIIGTFTYYVTMDLSAIVLLALPYPFFYLAFKKVKARNIASFRSSTETIKLNKQFLLYMGLGLYIVKPLSNLLMLYLIQSFSSEIIIDEEMILKPVIHLIFFVVFCVLSIHTYKKELSSKFQ